MTFNTVHPINGIQLKKGERYAWQVKALINEDPSETKKGIDYKTESDVFEFVLKPDPQKAASVYPFAAINTYNNEVYYANDTLKILYKEGYSPGKINYSISSIANDLLLQKNEALEVVLGDNLLQIPLPSVGLKTGEQYWFELQNTSGQKFKLKFIKLQ